MRVGQTSATAARLPAWKLRRSDALRSRATRGDEAAFAELYRRHHRALYRYCRSILHHDEDARDALQSTMAKAFAALQTEERDFDLRPWLFRIAHNEAISLLRRRREALGLDSAEAVGLDSLPTAVEHRARLTDLVADLGDLPERQRAALVLRELIGLEHEEIAAVIGGTPRAVRQTIFEARAALHECAEGREMDCAEVQRILSDGDGRLLRRRRVRAHLRDCRSCRDFKTALTQRPADLALLAPPLPAAVGAALLGEVLAGANAGSVVAGGAATAGSAGGAALGTKLAVVAATAATAAGGALATGLVERPRAQAPSAPAAPAGRPAAAPAYAPAAQQRISHTGALPGARRTAPARPAPGPSEGDHSGQAAHRRHKTKPDHAPSGHAGKPAPPPTERGKESKPERRPPGQARKQAKPPHTKQAKPPHTPAGPRKQAKPPHTPTRARGQAKPSHAQTGARPKTPEPAASPPPADEPSAQAGTPVEDAGTQPVGDDAKPGKPSK
jgi:RNA polymerase sigma factor (sigma-70 family)